MCDDIDKLKILLTLIDDSGDSVAIGALVEDAMKIIEHLRVKCVECENAGR